MYARLIKVQTLNSRYRVTSATHQAGAGLCPTARTAISCGLNATSLDSCSYAESSQNARSSLFVACAVKGQFNLHLTKSFGPSDGAVKVTYGDVEGYVDTSGWTNEAAAITCRELGMNHRGARAIRKYFPRRHGAVWMLRILSCRGSEAKLEDCRHEWSVLSFSEASAHTYVSGVSCGESRINLTVDTATLGADTVGVPVLRDGGGALKYFCLSDEIYQYNGGHDNGAFALCREAGYKHVVKATEYRWRQDNVTLPAASGAIVNLVCGSTGDSLEECTYEDVVDVDGCVTQQPSSWSSVAALRCETRIFGTRVRLAGGASPFEGHVEIMHNGDWGAICDDRFDDYAATLVCKEIFGQQSTGHAVHGSRFATRNENFFVDDLSCLRNQHLRLDECDRGDWGEHDCSSCEQAGVVCSETPYLRQPTVTVEVGDGSLRVRCSAEGFPPARYQWFTNGTRRVITGSSIVMDCRELKNNLSYICNAYNEGGEQSVEVMVSSLAGCPLAVQDAPCSAQTGFVVVICLLSAACAMATLYVLYLRRLHQATYSGKVASSVSYVNPTFT